MDGKKILNGFLFLVLLGAIALHWVFVPNNRVRNYEILPEMLHSVAYESQGENPNFSDGKTLQPPVSGTISRGLKPLPYKNTTEDAVLAGKELKNPFKEEPAAIKRGAFIFQNYCTMCHGPSGAGDGTVTKRGVPPPPSLKAENAKNLPDGQIFHIITYGQGNMASHANQISREDRWKTVLYLRNLQKKP